MSALEAIKSILQHSLDYKQTEASLFEELEGAMEEDEQDFFRDLQKIPYAATILDKVKEHFHDLNIGFSKVNKSEVDASIKLRAADKHVGDKQIELLAKATLGLQEKVRDQGIAIGVLKKVILAQATKLEEVEAKVLNPGPQVTNYLEDAIQSKVKAAMEEFTKKVDDLKEELVEVKQENTRLKKENSKQALDNDETRQRGMKGNLRIYAPGASQTTTNGKTESEADMCRRLTQETSGADIKPGDVTACHRLPTTCLKGAYTSMKRPQLGTRGKLPD